MQIPPNGSTTVPAAAPAVHGASPQAAGATATTLSVAAPAVPLSATAPAALVPAATSAVLLSAAPAVQPATTAADGRIPEADAVETATPAAMNSPFGFPYVHKVAVEVLYEG